MSYMYYYFLLRNVIHQFVHINVICHNKMCLTLNSSCHVSFKFFVIASKFSEPYTAREARIHVRHIRDVMKSVDLQEAYNGVDCNSLSFLNVVTSGNLTGNNINNI